MKYRYATLFFLAAYIIQPTLLNLFSIYGFAPNLLLCAVVVFSFLFDDKNYGIILGTAFGILYDICYMQYVGVSAIGYFLLGISVVVIRNILNKENVITVLLITAFGTVAFNTVVWCMYAILGSNYEFMYMLRPQPYYILYNLVVAAIFYRLLIRAAIKNRRDRFYI